MDTKEKILAIAKNFYRYAENNLYILDKRGQLVPLVPNAIQKQIVEYVVDCLEKGEPIRLIVLKARQEGVSTIIEALIYWYSATHPHVHAKIIGHETDAALNLYQMFQRYYDNSNPIFKPTTKYLTKNDLYFDTDDGKGLKSHISTASAQNTETGRSQTIHWLHASEVAFWPHGDKLVAGLMQTVPLLSNTAIFIESTANGVGDFFYKTWQAAKKGESPLKPFFFPWFIHEEYRIPTEKLKDLTPDERTWKREFKLKDDQILWYRMKSKEFAHDPKKMSQEYPFTEQEAFLAAGRPRFNPYKLQAMEELCFDPGRFELLEPGFGTQDAKFLLKSLPGAPMKVWEQPQEGRQYVIGADVADVGEDKSVATIMDKDKGKTVARWRGDIEPSEFGELLEQLGRYYNKALVGVEINNHGLTTVQRLRDMNYEKLYRRERGKDERWEEFTSKLGWLTNRQSKPLMIDALAEAINTGKIIDHDLEFIRECFTFVIDDKGRTEAQEGSHDDTVMSTAIALQLFEWNDIVLNRRKVPSYKPSHYVNRKRENRLANA